MKKIKIVFGIILIVFGILFTATILPSDKNVLFFSIPLILIGVILIYNSREYYSRKNIEYRAKLKAEFIAEKDVEKEAKKLGRNWVIDDSEKNIDNRLKESKE